MARIIRIGIVLGLAAATLGVSTALAADVQSDAFERAAATQPAAPTDAHDRGSAVTPAPTPVVEDTGWTVSATDIVLVASVAVGLVVAGVLLVGAVRRLPPRGHPSLAHR